LNIIELNFRFQRVSIESTCLGDQTYSICVTDIHYLTRVFTLQSAVLTKSESIFHISKQIKTPSHIANVFFIFTTKLQTCEACFQFSYSFCSFGDVVYVSESPGAGTRGIGKRKKKRGEVKKKRIERMRMCHQHGNRYK
jgi:hypothetical protein